MGEGETIAGRYRLDERLGSGGMSQVWAATDVELGRRVALKFLARDADPARFEREARAAASLSHPNIVALYDYGTAEDGRPFMALECLAGGTLEERLAPGLPLPDDEADAVARDIAAGLAHAHARGVLHRDLKPANVLFDSAGRAKISDLGIARMSGAGTLTEAGTVLGTAAYISPEQARGEPATPASDVYSFGVVLFRLLTGRLPFEGDEPLGLVAQHATAEPPPIAGLRADAPPVLESVATAALAKDPAERPADGAALVAALSGAGAAAGSATAVLPSAAPAAAPPARRTRLAAAAAAVLLLAAGGAAAAVFLTAGSDADGGDVEGTTLPAPALSIPERATTATAPLAPAPPPPAPATSDETTTGTTTTGPATTAATTTTAPATTATQPATTEEVETEITDTVETEPPVTDPPPTTTDTVAQ